MKKKKARAVRSKREHLFIAVVYTVNGFSRWPDKHFAAFVNSDKLAAADAATKAAMGWQAKGNGPYRVLTGELTEEARITNIKFEKLG